MARKITEYKSLEFKSKVRVFQGVALQECVEAVKDIRIIRITDDNRDDVAITGASIPDGCEVPWHNVASAVRDVESK